MNQIHTIFPYKTMLGLGGDTYRSSWLFDDKFHGFEREPFVAGIPDMIDLATVDIPDAEDGFMLVFSARPYPTGSAKLHILKFVAEEDGGAWYRGKIRGQRMVGWLCPGLLRYFPWPPKEIFISMHEKIT